MHGLNVLLESMLIGRQAMSLLRPAAVNLSLLWAWQWLQTLTGAHQRKNMKQKLSHLESHLLADDVDVSAPSSRHDVAHG